jgi:uncharacterized protein involved in outer membrane biogenesis
MKKLLAVIGFSTGALLLVFAAAIFAFYHLIQVGEFRRFLIAEFESRSGLKLEIGAADVEIGWVLGVSFHDLTLNDPQRQITVVKAPKVLIRVSLLPLLRHKLVFYGVRLYEPQTQIFRDKLGRVPWLDAVFALPFDKVQDAGFALDLRDLRIEQGEVQFIDAFVKSQPVETRLAAIALSLHRARRVVHFQALRPAGNSGRSPLELDIDVEAVVHQGERKGDLALRGRALFGEAGIDLRQARFDAYLNSTKFPAALFWDYLGQSGTVQALQGDLAYRIHWQGSWQHGARIACEVRFANLQTDAPDWFRDAVVLGDGRIDAVLDWKPQAVRFERFDMRSNRLSLSAQGSISALDSGDPHVALRLNTPFLPLTVVRQYLPTNLLQPSRLEYVARGLQSGEVRLSNAEISGRLSDLGRLSESRHGDLLSFEAEIRGAEGNYSGESSLALSGGGGGISLQRGVLEYKNLRGTVGKSRILDLSGTQGQPFSNTGPLDLRVRGEVDLTQLKEQLTRALLPAAIASKIDSLRDVGGRARLDLSVRGDSVDLAKYDGVASIEGGRFRIGSIGLSQIRGDVRLSAGEIRADRATATLNGSDLRLRFLLKDFATNNGTFDFAVESPGVKASDALSFLLPLDTSKSPGIVRGAIRYHGSLASPDDASLTGELDLAGARIALPVFAEPFRDVNGRVRLDGKTIDLEGMSAKVGGYSFNLEGRWRGGESPMLAFNLSSPEMDIEYILPRHVIPDEEWYERLQVRGKLALDRGKYDRFSLTDVRTDLILEKRLWSLARFTAQAQGGTIAGSASFNDRGESFFTVEPTVKGVPLQTVLTWFGVGSSEVTGKVQLSGNLAFSGGTTAERRRSLNGALRARIEDGMMRRFQVAVRVLSFLDLSRWFTLKLPNINQEGIRFRSISADVKIAQGVYSTKNFFLDGDDLRITGEGELDGSRGDLDFIIAVRPFPGLDTAWNYIPVLGTGLAAIKNSLLVASFHVRGPVEDPSVTPAPLSTLSEFFYGALAIPKGLIGLPATGAPKEVTAAP